MKAIVLINAQIDAKQEVKKQLEALGVLKFEAYGAYQFIAEVKFDDSMELRDFVHNEIRRIKGIQSTYTLPVSSSWSVY